MGPQDPTGNGVQPAHPQLPTRGGLLLVRPEGSDDAVPPEQGGADVSGSAADSAARAGVAFSASPAELRTTASHTRRSVGSAVNKISSGSSTSVSISPSAAISRSTPLPPR